MRSKISTLGVKKIFQKIKNNKNQIIAISLFSFLLIFVFQTDSAHAMGVAAEYVGNKFQASVVFLYGKLMSFGVFLAGIFITLVIKSLILIGGYNEFILEGAVVNAWIQVRNFSNMFFVLAMLVIAFATMFKYENYAVKRMLPKVIIMAFLVNFSRTICGLIIDFSQVFMATFLAPIGTTGGSYVQALGIEKYLTMVTTSQNVMGSAANEVKLWESIAGLTIGFIFTLIAGVVLAVILITLLMRVVFLWIYVILSPLAFMLYAFPGGQKYFNQWLGEFTKYVMIGPLLAFFVWLALVVGGTADMTKGLIDAPDMGGNSIAGQLSQSGANAMGNTGNFIHFIIAIGMLVGGLKVSSEMGGAAGSTAGKGLAAISKGQKVAVNFGKQGLKYTARKTGQAAGSTALSLVSKMPGDTKVGRLATNWNKGLKDARVKSSKAWRLKKMKSLGMNEDARANVGEIANSRGARKVKEFSKFAAGSAMIATGNPLAAVAGLMTYFSSQKGSRERHGRDNYDDHQKVRDSKIKASERIMSNEIQVAANTKNSSTAGFKATRDAAIVGLDKSGPAYKAANEAFSIASKPYDDIYNNDVENAKEQHNNRILNAIDDDKTGRKRSNITDDKNKEVIKIETDLEKELRKIKTDIAVRAGLAATTLERDQIEIDGGIEINEAELKAQGKIGKLNTDYNDAIARLDNPHEDFKDYHPNNLIMGAVTEGEKESSTAKNRGQALTSGADGSKFGVGSMYSDDGQTAVQKKLFEYLVKGDSDSAKAVNNLESSMKKLLTRQLAGAELTAKELANVKAWKQGIAAADKGGVNIGTLAPVVEIINQIQAKGEDAPRTVDDYKPEVIKN